jgi:transcription initiation protein SPT3
LIRDDRGKVNRLRTYLSWKDVRKKAKDDDDGRDLNEVDLDDANGNSQIRDWDIANNATRRKTMVKLPWDNMAPFIDFLRSLPSRKDDEEDDDEDELQAYEDSMQRLRVSWIFWRAEEEEADEATKKMTKDEYVHYSDCRQASFTYRKGKSMLTSSEISEEI